MPMSPPRLLCKQAQPEHARPPQIDNSFALHHVTVRVTFVKYAVENGPSPCTSASAGRLSHEKAFHRWRSRPGMKCVRSFLDVFTGYSFETLAINLAIDFDSTLKTSRDDVLQQGSGLLGTTATCRLWTSSGHEGLWRFSCCRLRPGFVFSS